MQKAQFATSNEQSPCQVAEMRAALSPVCTWGIFARQVKIKHTPGPLINTHQADAIRLLNSYSNLFNLF